MTALFNYQAPNNLLNNKTILVTGANRGIGRAIALSYAKHGATVLLHGKDVSALESVYDDIINQGYPEPFIIPLDLATAHFDQYQETADLIQQACSELNGLVHNAGILGRLCPIQDTLPDDMDKIWQINVKSAFMLTKTLLPLMQQSTSSSIIFTSSSVGKKGRAYWGGYTMSKFAIEGLMQVLADELENTSTIRVNAINPGATATEMRRSAYPAEPRELLRTPEEIMPVYLYLMGKDSESIHGKTLSAQQETHGN